MTHTLHIEPTTVCNARCPQCDRETDPTFDRSKSTHLTVSQIKRSLDPDLIQNLRKVFLCGNYGDPAAGRYTQEIFKFFKQQNSKITLGMNTNGGLRSAQWWRSLAQLLDGPEDYVVFSIDGLEDTNGIYRIGTTWSKIIANAQAFIAAGGSAHWDMLVFEHNQHQVSQAQQLAQRLGFTWFRSKVSRRFQSKPVTFLKPPRDYTKPTEPGLVIDCQAIRENSIYINAAGVKYPCCWLANSSYTIDRWQDVQQSWHQTPVSTCQAVCARTSLRTPFLDQWRQEIKLA